MSVYPGNSGGGVPLWGGSRWCEACKRTVPSGEIHPLHPTPVMAKMTAYWCPKCQCLSKSFEGHVCLNCEDEFSESQETNSTGPRVACGYCGVIGASGCRHVDIEVGPDHLCPSVDDAVTAIRTEEEAAEEAEYEREQQEESTEADQNCCNAEPREKTLDELIADRKFEEQAAQSARAEVTKFQAEIAYCQSQIASIQRQILDRLGFDLGVKIS